MAESGSRRRKVFKKFSFKGIDLDKLVDLPSNELMDLMPARVRRRFRRAVEPKNEAGVRMRRSYMNLRKKVRAAKKAAPEGEKPKIVKTHLRNALILPEMIGAVVGVHNGKMYAVVEVKPEMVGKYFGEYSITYKPTLHGRPGLGATHSSRFIPLR